MKKILLTLLIIAILTFSLSVSAFAQDSGEAQSDEVQQSGAEANPFEALYAFFLENSTEIFSTLAFLGSLTVAVCYKRGMLPALADAVGGIGTAVGGLRSDNASALSDITAKSADMLEKMGVTQSSLADAAELIRELSERLATAEETKNELDSIRCAISVQIDVLYDIFMASSLPQYRKDLIGERVSEMKSFLEEAKNEGVSS